VASCYGCVSQLDSAAIAHLRRHVQTMLQTPRYSSTSVTPGQTAKRGSLPWPRYPQQFRPERLAASLGRRHSARVQKGPRGDGSAFTRPACMSHPASGVNPSTSKSGLQRDEAELHFVSVRPLLHYGARGELSRVKMNTLRVPLIALPVPRGMCWSFLV
jgi:hypothetical protein